MDLRYPFNCPDNPVDGIYSGHTIEHLWPAIFCVNIFIAFLVIFIRLYFGHMVTGMNIKAFFKNGIFPISIPISFSTFFAFLQRLFLL